MDKWFWIAVAVMLLGMGVHGAVDAYGKSQCRIAAIQRGMPAAEIAQVCK